MCTQNICTHWGSIPMFHRKCFSIFFVMGLIVTDRVLIVAPYFLGSCCPLKFTFDSLVGFSRVRVDRLFSGLHVGSLGSLDDA